MLLAAVVFLPARPAGTAAGALRSHAVSLTSVQPSDMNQTELKEAEDGDVHLFFLVGQSNMVGLGNGSALSAELLQRLQDLSRLTDPAPPVSFYAANNAGGASTTYGSTTCGAGISWKPLSSSYATKEAPTMDKTDGDSLWIEQVERLPLAPVLSCKYEQDLMRPGHALWTRDFVWSSAQRAVA